MRRGPRSGGVPFDVAVGLVPDAPGTVGPCGLALYRAPGGRGAGYAGTRLVYSS